MIAIKNIYLFVTQDELNLDIGYLLYTIVAY